MKIQCKFIIFSASGCTILQKHEAVSYTHLASDGTVKWLGKDTAPLSLREKARIFGYVPQNTQAGLSLTVMETVISGRLPFSRGKTDVYKRQIYTGIDNGTGDAWSEDFDSREECMKWLRRESAVDAHGEPT